MFVFSKKVEVCGNILAMINLSTVVPFGYLEAQELVKLHFVQEAQMLSTMLHLDSFIFSDAFNLYKKSSMTLGNGSKYAFC